MDGLHLSSHLPKKTSQTPKNYWRKNILHFQNNTTLGTNISPTSRHFWGKIIFRTSRLVGIWMNRSLECNTYNTPCWAVLLIFVAQTHQAGWWFQRYFIFTPTWGRFPIWLIFCKWVGSTTNQPSNEQNKPTGFSPKSWLSKEHFLDWPSFSIKWPMTDVSLVISVGGNYMV